MSILMDGLLMAASLFAGGYCWVLARRLRALKDLDSGLGGSIVSLTRQIELARGTLDEARSTARDNRRELDQLIARADSAASQLKLLLGAARAPSAMAIEPASAIAHPASKPPPARPKAAAGMAPVAVPKPQGLRALDDLLLSTTSTPARTGGRAAGSDQAENDILDALNVLAGGES
jgi:hypothetical protein